MKLTEAILNRMIRETLEEKKNEEFSTNVKEKEYKKQMEKDREERRKKEKELRPDYDLMKLSKGILEEQELLIEPDNEGYVRIKKDALERVLSENTGELQRTCNNASYYQLNQILDFISKMNKAQKGKP
jgi:hypothetical protein